MTDVLFFLLLSSLIEFTHSQQKTEEKKIKKYIKKALLFIRSRKRDTLAHIHTLREYRR